MGAAGHVFTILDEDRNVVSGASLWLGGREYRADAEGGLVVPFSSSPSRQTILLRHGNLTTLESFDHQAESYSLECGLYVDRESLLKKKEAQVVVRAALRVNGQPASLKLLESTSLFIESTDQDGVSSSQEVSGFELFEDKESTHTFQVPERLASLTLRLTSKVQVLATNRKLDLSAQNSVQLNGIDKTAHIDALHLAHAAEGYVLYHLGKSGEPRVDSPLYLQLTHRDITPRLTLTLQTDAQGRVELGHLRDITQVEATAPSGVRESFALPVDSALSGGVIHVREGESFRVPLMEITTLGSVVTGVGE